MSHSEDKAKVMEVIEGMTNALHAGDIDGVLKRYESGASVVFYPGVATTGIDNLRAKFEESYSIRPQFTYSGHEIFVSQDIATHFAPWKMRGTAPDGSVIEASGLSVAVLRRQKNGEWLMIFDNPYGDNLFSQSTG